MAPLEYDQVHTSDCRIEEPEETQDSTWTVGCLKSPRSASRDRELRERLQDASQSEERRAFRPAIPHHAEWSRLEAMAVDTLIEEFAEPSHANLNEERRAFRVAPRYPSDCSQLTEVVMDELDELRRSADPDVQSPHTSPRSDPRRRFYINTPKGARPCSMPLGRRYAQRALLTGSTRTKTYILGRVSDAIQNQRAEEALSPKDAAAKADTSPPLSASANAAWEEHTARVNNFDTFCEQSWTVDQEHRPARQTTSSDVNAANCIDEDCIDEDFVAWHRSITE